MNLYFWITDLLSRPAVGLGSRVALFPLVVAARVYGALLLTRRWLYRVGLLRGYRPGVPVISVGNVTAGGTGKTPCVQAVCRMLLAEGVRPAVLSRGYGGRRRGGWAAVSDGDRLLLDYRAAGDEPVLLAQALPGVPILVGPDRTVTAREAVQRYGAEALVLDDGYQHLGLERDLDIVTVDVRNPLGNGYCLPRGLLREPPQSLTDADVILLTRAQRQERSRLDSLDSRVRRYNDRAPVLLTSHAPVRVVDLNKGACRSVEEMVDLKILAFAGIGNPAAFFQDLAALGARVIESVPFPDHHAYCRKDLDKLLEWARLMNAEALVTTEKDAVRLLPLLPASGRLLALGIELEFLEGEETFRELLRRTVRRN